MPDDSYLRSLERALEKNTLAVDKQTEELTALRLLIAGVIPRVDSLESFRKLAVATMLAVLIPVLTAAVFRLVELI